jgi:F0F1-type ATP synthase assembly protein I
VNRPFKPWQPFLFALQLWLVVLLAASVSLYGGLLLDARLKTTPVLATLGLGVAFVASLVAGLAVVQRATGRPLLQGRAADTLRQAGGYALRLVGIILGIGAAGVYGGWFLDARLSTTPLLSIVGVVLGFTFGTWLALRYTVFVLQRERSRTPS